MRAFWLIPCLLLPLCLLGGCVERWFFIQSEPSGAAVFIDGTPVGKTPLKVPFDHYGTREILLRHDDYLSQSRLETVRAPWYQWFPIDLLAEQVWPGTIQDIHEVRFTLDEIDRDKLKQELEKLRKSPDGRSATDRG